MARRSSDKLSQLPEIEVDNPASLHDISEISSVSVASMPLPVLIAEAHILKNAMARLSEIKSRIVELVQADGLADDDGHMGARYLHYCTIVRWQGGRRTFNRELAIENGITPEQIEASMKEGEGSWICELPEMEV